MQAALARPLLVVLVLSCAVGGAVPPAPDADADADIDVAAFLVETLAGERLVGRLAEATPEHLVLVTPSGRRTIGRGEALLAGTPPGPPSGEPPPTGRDLLVLASAGSVPGDRLWGALDGGDEHGLDLTLAGAGRVRVPFEHVDRLLPRVDRPVDRLLSLAGGGFDDKIWRRRADGTLDGITGVVAQADADTVVLEAALGNLELPVPEVLAMVLAATEPSGRELSGWPVRARLHGGSSFEAGLLGGDEAGLRFATHFEDELFVPREALATVLFVDPSAGVVPLAGLEPVAVQQWSPLGGEAEVLFPWRTDLSVSGVPLLLGGVGPATGLGVHANARLVYEVPEGCSRLRASVGPADEVATLPAEATLTFSVLVDGQERAASGVVREGGAPIVLRVDGLLPGDQLELVTGDAGDLDAGDRAVWADAVFLP